MVTRNELLPYKPRIQYNSQTDVQKLMDFPIMYDDVFYNPKQYGFKGIICQNDIDGITSGESYSEYSGLPIVGVFDYQSLMVFEEHKDIDIEECIWVDCDIVDNRIYSIGNHVTMFTNRDSVSDNNFNLSNYYSLHGQQPNVYPFHYTGSTLLMLYALGFTNITTDDGKRLALFADGTWNNKAKFEGTKVDLWLEKLNVYDDLSPFMPETKTDPRYNDFIRLSKHIGYRRGTRYNKPFRFNPDGTIHCDYDLNALMELLGIRRPSQLDGRPMIEKMSFNTDARSTKLMQYHDKRDFESFWGIGELFAVTFLSSNKVVYCSVK